MTEKERPVQEQISETRKVTDILESMSALPESLEPKAVEPNKKKKPIAIVVRCAANIFLPLACTFGGYVVLHGDTSPGGGFQGGVLLASAVLLVFLGYGGQKLSTTFREGFLHSTETVAELMYVAIGLIGILVGLDFAANILISDFHIETTVLMNDAVGYHVMAGVGCLLIMMLGMLSSSDSDEDEEEEEEE